MNKIILIVILAIILLILVVGVQFIFNKNEPAAISLSGTDSASYDIQGMKVEILEEGSGPATKSGDTITVNYVGTLNDPKTGTPTKFDSSIDRGQPFVFTLGQNSVIQGWELGVLGMKVGEKRRLTIPPELAYGSAGAGEIIPPNATLIFEIDMLGINSK